MPCDTARVSTIQLDKSDPQILHDAMKELGWSPLRSGSMLYFSGGEYDTKTGELRLRTSDAETRTALLKRAYSGQVVVQTAKRFNWSVKPGKEKYSYVIQKRSL